MSINTLSEVRHYQWIVASDHSNKSHFHITEFYLSDIDGKFVSPLLNESKRNIADYILNGVLVHQNSSARKQFRTKVVSYVLDLGEKTTSIASIWMMGTDINTEYKLLVPDALHFHRDTSSLLRLCNSAKELKPYLFDGHLGTFFSMANFSLTDKESGDFQPMFALGNSNKTLVLSGTLELHDPAHGDLPRALSVRTYVRKPCCLELGAADASFCMEDIHGHIYRLVGPCHPEYAETHQCTVRSSVGRMNSYHWPAEEESQVWRHITNYRVTDSTGKLHYLEIGHLDGTFLLLGELLPAPSAQIPVIPIPVMVKVVTHSIDIGRHMGDPDRGVWMQDYCGSWYKLGTPVQAFQRCAKPLLYKAEQFLQLSDALLFQNLTTAQFLPNKTRYGCALDIYAVHRGAQPAFDLQFVKAHKDFVLQHLAALFDEDAASTLLNSIRQMDDGSIAAAAVATRTPTRPATSPKQTALQRELLKLRASGALPTNGAAVRDAFSDASMSEGEVGEVTSTAQKQQAAGMVTPKARIRKRAITPSKKKAGDSTAQKRAKPIAKRPRAVSSPSSSSFSPSEQQHGDGSSAHSDHIDRLLPKLTSLAARKSASTAGAGVDTAQTRNQNTTLMNGNAKYKVITRASVAAADAGSNGFQSAGPPPPPAGDLVSEQQLQWWKEVQGWWQQQQQQLGRQVAPTVFPRPLPPLTLPPPATSAVAAEAHRINLADAYHAAPPLPPALSKPPLPVSAPPPSTAPGTDPPLPAKKKRGRFDDTPGPDPAPAVPAPPHSRPPPKQPTSVVYTTTHPPSHAVDLSSSPVLGEGRPLGSLRNRSDTTSAGMGRGRTATLPAWMTSTSISAASVRPSVAAPLEHRAQPAPAAASEMTRQEFADLHRGSGGSSGGAGRGRSATMPAWAISDGVGGVAAFKSQLSKIHDDHAAPVPATLRQEPTSLLHGTKGLNDATKINSCSSVKAANGHGTEVPERRRAAKSRSWLDDDKDLPAPAASLSSRAPVSDLSQAGMSDQCLGIDSAKANLDAVDALLNSLSALTEQTVSSGNNELSNTDSGEIFKPTQATAAAVVVAGDHSPTTTTLSLPAPPGRRDDKDVERARYASKHHHGQQQQAAAPQARTGWGGLLGLVKLGAREDDPKKRLELTTRSALGAFAPVRPAGQYSPPGRAALPSKSSIRGQLPRALRSGSGSSMEEGQLASGSCGSFSPVSVKWQDMKEGSQLYTRHSYSPAAAEESGSEQGADAL